MSIWESLKPPIICLAPMEGVTDVMFRQVIAHASRPDLFFTEFTNVSSFASEKGRANALERLEIAPSDPPIIAQIWGKNPDHFSELCSALNISKQATLTPVNSDSSASSASLSFAGIDLNFGCPDRHVNSAGGGAQMIRTPDLARECIRRAKSSAPNLPVSVKTRLGFTYLSEYRDWLPTILSEHPAALTVHLRTRKEMSKVPAHFELIPKLLQLRDQYSPETKLLINGDIKSRAHALRLWEQYPGLDGFMIGRGVFSNPFCFKPTPDGSDYLPTKAELFKLLNLHLSLFQAQAEKYQHPSAHPEIYRPDFLSATPSPHPLSFEPLKHFFKIYINNFPGASDLRAELMLTHSVAEARELIAQLQTAPST